MPEVRLGREAIDADNAEQRGLVEEVTDELDRAVSRRVDSLLAGDPAHRALRAGVYNG